MRRVYEHKTLHRQQVDSITYNPSQHGFICPIETPDNHNVGRIIHLATGCQISQVESSKKIKNFLMEQGITAFDELKDFSQSLIFLNGDFVGGTKRDVQDLCSALRKYRRKNNLQISCNVRHGDVYIYTDAGRPIQPVFLTENGKLVVEESDLNPNVSLEVLQNQNKVDFLDCEEKNQSAIAKDKDSIKETDQYCFTNPVLILGVAASIVPLISHIPPFRAMVGSRMVKQAFGKQKMTTDDQGYIDAPETPLVVSFMAKALGLSNMYSGQRALVAIMPVRGGYNEDDGIVMRKKSIEHGLFDSTHVTTIKINVENQGYEYATPGEFLRHKKPFCVLQNGKKFFLADDACSPFLKQVYMNNYSQVLHFVFEYKRRLLIGDKMSDFSGMKGVVCHLRDDDEMPRMKDGTIPDVIMSPHSFPKRMTVGCLMDIAMGIIAMHKNEVQYVTAFQKKWTGEYVLQTMKELGISTTQPFYTSQGHLIGNVYCGPLFYMRLAQLVSKKSNVILKPRMELGAPLPIHGLSQGGGLRLGEMEMYAMLSSNNDAELTGFFKRQLGRYPYCRTCCLFAVCVRKFVFCPRCKEEGDVAMMELPVETKLWVDQCHLAGVGFKVSHKPLGAPELTSEDIQEAPERAEAAAKRGRSPDSDDDDERDPKRPALETIQEVVSTAKAAERMVASWEGLSMTEAATRSKDLFQKYFEEC
ncbi:DNA-directed RNA polymerase II subunit rpb2-like [Penaeus japonicus]|uniref:DNA-directed RNA polymerase II subunit rpb2-like n=1 Tax=Penaeus japonicus TaxID=27405 RepID=UPI001C7170ED|nr:DNA-directed RNA polymerase II subunit rpb2-like [Penaeus japonicus]